MLVGGFYHSVSEEKETKSELVRVRIELTTLALSAPRSTN